MSRVHIRNLLFLMLTIVLSGSAALGQNSSFTYQGRLTDGGASANGNYDLQVALFDSETGGLQVGQTQTITSVPVTGGVFSVTLDFGPAAFPGAARFLEIGMRSSGVGNYTLLTPRQAISATPYAVRSLNATNADNATTATNAATAATATDAQKLGGVTAGNYVQTNDARLSDARPPTAGNSNYIQNTTTQQGSSNFNISGNGTAGGTLSGSAVSATTRFDLGGLPVLKLTGKSPTFDGLSLGSWAIGGGAGNTVIGWEAGTIFPDSNDNTFLGKQSGFPNTSHGSNNTLLGAYTKFSDSVSNATAIGANASVAQSNSLVLGNGVNVGIGTSSPRYKLHVVGTDVRVESSGSSIPRFSLNYASAPTDTGRWQNYAADNKLVFSALNDAENAETIWLRVNRLAGTNILTNVEFPTSFVRINQLTGGGSNSICRDSTNQLAFCSSSIRYKTNIADWRSGLNLVNRLRPVTFDWKDSRAHDLGLVAEEVAAAEPLLVTRNEKGEVEGVKYDRLSAVFINAFKEQQAQIERQQAEVTSQQNQIEQQQAQLKAQENQIKAQDKALVMLRTRLASLEQEMRHPRARQRKAFVSRR